MSGDDVRLVDLLMDPELGLELVSDCNPHIPVTGAHAIEIAHPTQWLEPGTVMLTTGSVFSGDLDNPAQALRTLVHELVAGDVAALGYGVGVATEQVPRALIDEANRHHFAVFTVPPAVSFMTVVNRVVEQTHAGPSHSLRRALQMQDQLLDALAAAEPEQELIGRLASMLRSSVVLFNEFGDVVASSGRAPSHLIRAQLRGRAGRLRFSVGKWSVTAESVDPGGEKHWLVVASTRHELPDDLARVTVDVAIRLLNAIERSRYRATTENRTRQASFVRSLIAGEIVDQFSAESHLEALRFGHRPRLRLFVLASDENYDEGRWRTRAATALDAVEEDAVDIARLMRLPVMFGQYDDQIVGVLPADIPPLNGWIASLSEKAVCGFSEPFHDVRSGPERYRNAQRALRAAHTRGLPFINFEDVGITDWLLTGQDPATTLAKAVAQMSPLGDNDDYLSFLGTHFERNLDVMATARALGVHPNTVRHRIKRVEEMFGESLRSPALISAIHLSLEVLALDRNVRAVNNPLV